MNISNNYVMVERIEEPVKEGFQTVEVQDSFVYRGHVVQVGEAPVFLGNKQIAPGDTVLFAKYSPDTHLIELEGIDYKFVSVKDLIAVL